ncbi:MAG: DUF2142 domain-containing protein [Candidatus Moranbacteria bacterium]|nr:DUF2142 domain-containing protein [Candidatus Moranbacteria bacterium]
MHAARERIIRLYGCISETLGRIRPEFLFLTLVVPLSLATAFLTPPLQAPDETQHLFRSWGIATGQVFCSPGSTVSVPKNLFTFAETFEKGVSDDGLFRYSMLSDWNRSASLSGPETQVYTQFCSYNPITHLPQAIGMFLANSVHGSVVSTYYGASFGNAIVAIFLIFLAIRLVPFGKTYFLLAGLASGIIGIVTTVNGDALSIGGLLFLAALFLRMSDGRTLGRYDLPVLLAASLLFIHAKPAYIGFTMLAFLIPSRAFPSKRSFLFFLATFFAANILLATVLASYADTGSYLRPEGVDPAAQATFIRSHPLPTVVLIAEETVTNLPRYIGAKTGRSLPYYAAFAFVVLMLGLDGIRPSRRTRITLPLIVFGTAALIELLEYLFWNEPGASNIRGIQSRYYYGLLPLLFLAAHAPFRRLGSISFPNGLRIIAVTGITITVAASSLIDLDSKYHKTHLAVIPNGTPVSIDLGECAIKTDDLSIRQDGSVETLADGNYAELDASGLSGLSFETTGTGAIGLRYRFRGDEKFPKKPADDIRSTKRVSVDLDTLAQREGRPLDRIRITFSDRPEAFSVNGLTAYYADSSTSYTCGNR